ncbi:hypothetical protein A3A67_01315 [Candidatus Peribacteria bacterium RIFCSPLOWO2_01_FULL_51_18]|nr:MAG: hypothetical protein A3C52_00020 [Candidatus Peribacteria bacterium RIFCSPHIGHO2_02_FULL_51_15]OGJ65483.1 MAG: hypothetical protein A3A67_01315 [Candidatus Peribacteria bacterium RIFCSPLOWO2_01_FULL_51_18]OGJ67595.1 MAG: hypothetical protein A3J34_00720 [Candidatus Peribacteria bacterium RIFCSPLOWO2_02_FULL_51_10]
MNILIFPFWRRLFGSLREGWMKISRAIGVVMSSILLTVLWVTVFGIYALILKLAHLFGAGKSRAQSLWIPVNPEETGGLSNQF